MTRASATVEGHPYLDLQQQQPRRDARPFDELLGQVYAFADPAITSDTAGAVRRLGELACRPDGGHA